MTGRRSWISSCPCLQVLEVLPPVVPDGVCLQETLSDWARVVSWQAHAGLPLIGPDGQQVKRFHAYGPQWADMAQGSGYETVVHKQPLLRWV
jgi:hypothetical protein